MTDDPTQRPSSPNDEPPAAPGPEMPDSPTVVMPTASTGAPQPGYVPPGYPGGPWNYPGAPGGPPNYPPQPYPPPPSNGGGHNKLLIVGGLAALLVVLLGIGGMFAFGIGPFAPAPTPTQIAQPSTLPTASPIATPTVAFSPSPTPSASPSPTASPTPEPTASPTLEPTVSPEPTPTLEPSPTALETPTGVPAPSPTSSIPPTALPSGDPAQVLLGHIPEDVAATCVPSTGTPPVLASASCSADDGELLVVYDLYGTREEMNAAFQGYLDAAQIEPETGSCPDFSTWPTENEYTVGGLPVGRYLCMQTGIEPATVPTIYWTDDRFNVLTQASHALGDQDRLLEFWVREAGPI